MTSTLQRTGQLDVRAIPAPADMNGSVTYTEDSNTSVGSDSLSGDVNLNVVLPDGTTQTIVVEAAKQMMDLLVQVAASNKLSPPKHMLKVYHEETGHPIEFKASKAIGSLGVSTVYLVRKEEKEQKKKKPVQHNVNDGTLPFVKTQRLTANLPKGQKHLLRIDPKCTLGQIYHKICEEKGLDPYKYELRHPTIRDEPLNMSRPLHEYGLAEINVVSVNTPDSPPPSEFRTLPAHYESNLRPASSVTSINSTVSEASAMSKRRDEEGYMPGSGVREKKKKGLFSFFSRKKQSGSFTPASGSAEVASSSKPPTHPASSRQSVPVQHAMPPSQHTKTLPTQHTSNMPQSNHGAPPPPQVVQVQTQSLPRPTSRLAAPTAPNRKKRHAPPPPGLPVAKPIEKPVTEPVTVTVTETVTEVAVNGSKEIHSRQSSRSSGFEDTPGSPVESPGTSSEGNRHQTSQQLKTSIDGTSVSSTEVTTEQTVTKTVSETLPRVREVSDQHDHMSDVSSLPDSAQGSLPRPSKPNRGKKKMAPAPPPPAAGASAGEVSTSQVNVNEQTTSIKQIAIGASSTATTEAEPDVVMAESDIPVVRDSTVEATNRAVVDSITTTHSTTPVDGATAPGSSTERVNGVGEVSEKTVTTQTASVTQSTPSKSRPCLFIAPPPPDSPPPPDTPPGRTRARHMSDKGVEVADLPYSDISDSDSGTDSEDEVTRIQMSTFVEQMKELTDKANTEDNINNSHTVHERPDNETKTNKPIVDTNSNIDTVHLVEEYKIKGSGDANRTFKSAVGSPDNVELDVVDKDVEPAVADMDNTVVLVKKEVKSEFVDRVNTSVPLSVSTQHGSHKQSHVPLESPVDSGHSSGDLIGDDEIMFDMDEVVYEEPAQGSSFTSQIQSQGKQVYVQPRSQSPEIDPVVMETIYENETTAEPYMAGSSDSGDPDSEDVVIETETVIVHPDGTVTVTKVTETKPPGTPLLQEQESFLQQLPDRVDSPVREPSPPPVPQSEAPVKETTPPVTSLRAAYRNNGRPKAKPAPIQTNLNYDINEEPLPIPIFQTKSEESNITTTDEEVPTEVDSDSPEVHRKKFESTHLHMRPHEEKYLHVDPRTKPEVKKPGSSILKKKSDDIIQPDIEIIETTGSVYNPEDTNVIIYNKTAKDQEESSTFNNYMKSKPRKQRDMQLYGPRGWGQGRNKSEPSVKDVRAALVAAEIKQKDLIGGNIKDDDQIVYAGDGSMRGQTSPLQPKVMDINFIPTTEYEKENMMEEKSITQIAFPVERKSEPYVTSGSHGVRVCDGISSPSDDVNHTGTFTLNFASKQPQMTQEVIQSRTREQSAQALQDQYNQLQAQFAKWQDQLQENQALLSQKKIVPPQDVMVAPSSPTPQETPRPIPIDTYPEPRVEHVEDTAEKREVESKPVSILKTSNMAHSDNVEKPSSKPAQQKVQRRQRDSGPTSFVMRSSYVPRPLRDSHLLGRLSPTEISPVSVVSSKPEVKDNTVKSRPKSYHERVVHTEPVKVERNFTKESLSSEPVKSEPKRAKSEPFRSESVRVEPVNRIRVEPSSSQPSRSLSSASHVKSLKGNFEVTATHKDRQRPLSHHEMHQKSVFPPHEESFSHSAPINHSSRSRSTPSVHGNISMPSYRQDTPPTPPPTPVKEEPTRAKSEPPATKPKPRTPDHLKNDPRFMPKLDPREELMIAIRNAGGKQVLRQTSPS